MIVFLNGKFVPERDAWISVFDRGFLYGDGLFETMRVFNGRPFRWGQHLERVETGARLVGIRIPFTSEELRSFANRLIVRNRLADCLLRLTISRGAGPRGYSPQTTTQPTVALTLHPAPPDRRSAPRWSLVTSSLRLPANETLARFKSSNKLIQVMARAQADAAGAQEALLRNSRGLIVEGAGSNLFWIERGCVFTPPLDSGILPGITRAVVLELCQRFGFTVREACPSSRRLYSAEGVFLSLSSIGIAEGISLNGRALRRSPVTARLYKGYRDLVRRECG